MSRHTANNLTTIRCNAPASPGSDLKCLSVFVTASIQRVSRKQAKLAGWFRLPAWTVTKDDSPRRIYDLCPNCGPAAAEIQKNRASIRLNEALERRIARDAAKDERAKARAAKREAKAAEKIARAERKALRTERKRLGLRPLSDPRPIPPSSEYSAISTDEEHAIDRAWATAGDVPFPVTRYDTTGEGEFADDGSWRDSKDPSVQACDGEHPAPVCGVQCWRTQTPADSAVAAAQGFAFDAGGKLIARMCSVCDKPIPEIDSMFKFHAECQAEGTRRGMEAQKIAREASPAAPSHAIQLGQPCGFGINGGECYACELARKAGEAGWSEAKRPMTRAEISEAHHDVFPPPASSQPSPYPGGYLPDLQTQAIEAAAAHDEKPPATPRAPRQPRAARTGPSVLDVVERLLRARGGSLSVAEIVGYADGTLPTQSKTPATIVSRDLALDIKAHGDASRFVRTAPGRFSLRAWAALEIAPPEAP